MTRAERTYNPFALIQQVPSSWQGLVGKEPDGFLVFINNTMGARAGFINLINAYFRRGLNTPNKIFSVYAPLGHGANDPQAYSRIVSDHLNIRPDQEVPPEMLYKLGEVITRIERGSQLSSQSLHAGYELAIANTGFQVEKKKEDHSCR
jgi:hypothetical protein